MWVVTLTYRLTLDEAEFNRLADALDDVDAGVFNLPSSRVMVTYGTDAPDPVKAATVAREHVGLVIHQEPTGIEVVMEDDYGKRADAPNLPRLVSAPEVAELLNVSRQRVHQIRSLPAFPAPLYELRTGAIWDARAIEKFGRDWARRPGRPTRTAV